MVILFLHGFHSVPGGVKPTYLKDHGHTVINPALNDDDFYAAVRTAQAEYDRHQPDVIVGSSRGGAVAMNINSSNTPLVLLCPAWKRWGTARRVKPGTIILHCPDDDTVPFSDSEELVEVSGLPESALLETGTDHRLADPESLEHLLEACWDDRYHAIHEASHAVVSMKLGLSPKRLSIGRFALGTSGGIEFHSQAALERDPARKLTILVAGKVGTRLHGYKNRLVSEKLADLDEDNEPGWMSDEALAWESGCSDAEIQVAEASAEQVLARHAPLVVSIADALMAKRELDTKAIKSIADSGPN